MQTGALEGQQFLKGQNKVLVNISEQNIIDCSFGEGNLGCLGGLPEFSFLYVEHNNGIDSETAYPYMGQVITNYTLNTRTLELGKFVLPLMLRLSARSRAERDTRHLTLSS